MPDATDAEVLDQWRIATVMHVYYQAIDTFDWKTLDDAVLADDAVWEIVQRSSAGSVTTSAGPGRDQVVAWFEQMVGGDVSMREGTVRHFLGTHVIHVNGSSATSRSHLQAQDMVTLNMLANGVVDAEHVKTDRGWRIRRYHIEERITDADMEGFRAAFGLELDPRGSTMGQLDGKVAIVTGGARGTGEATARLFVKEGAQVVIGDILDDRGQSVADSLGEQATYTHLDITQEADWEAAVALTTERYGTPTVLINNAGVLVVKAVQDTTLEDFEYVLRVNQIGTFLGIKALVEPMRSAGGGAVVNVSSTDGIGGGNGRTAYCSSKWGVRGLTKAAAFDLGRFRIRVNAVCPGGGSAEMVIPWIPPGFDPAPVFEDVALRRPCEEAEELAAAIVFLASDAASYVSGTEFVVDGGYTAGHVIQGFPGD